MLNVTFSFLIARCIRWPGFVPIRISCRCVIDVVWLGLAWCIRLIRTLITVCSASFHRLLLEFDIPAVRPQLIHWSLTYQGLERPNLLDLSYRLRFECGMTFPTLCNDLLTPESWISSRVQSTVGCFPELCFLQFSVAQVLVGQRKQFIGKNVFPTSDYADCLNNNNSTLNIMVCLNIAHTTILALFHLTKTCCLQPFEMTRY